MMAMLALFGILLVGATIEVAIGMTILYWLGALEPLGLSPYPPKYCRTYTNGAIYIFPSGSKE